MKNTTLSLLCLLLLPGCGGGAEGTGGQAGGVPPGTSISKLDDAQANAQCAAYRDKIAQTLSDEHLCTTLSTFAAPYFFPEDEEYIEPTTPAEATAECERARPLCEASYSGDSSFARICEKPGPCILQDKDFRQQCGLPVSVVTACIDEMLAALQYQNEQYTCDRRWEVLNGGLDVGLLPRPSCDLLSKECGPLEVDLTQCSANLMPVVDLDNPASNPMTE